MAEPKVDLQVSPEEERKIDERTWIGAVVVHEAIRAEGEAELQRPTSALPWSGLASGLSMGFSFFVPTLSGNILGGVSLVVALNHAQGGGGDQKELAWNLSRFPKKVWLEDRCIRSKNG